MLINVGYGRLIFNGLNKICVKNEFGMSGGEGVYIISVTQLSEPSCILVAEDNGNNMSQSKKLNIASDIHMV